MSDLPQIRFVLLADGREWPRAIAGDRIWEIWEPWKPRLVAVAQHDFAEGEPHRIDDGWRWVPGRGVVCLRCVEFSLPIAEVRDDGAEIVYAEGMLNHQAVCRGRVASGGESGSG